MHTGLIEINWTSLMIVINLVILYLILRHFFFDKIRSFMLERENSIKDAFDSAEAMNKKADEKMEIFDKKIAGAEEEGRKIVKDAKVKAEAQARDIIDQANEKAAQKLSQAQREIEREKETAVYEMKQQVAVLALMAAQKIMEKDIKAEGQDEIIEQVLEQAGKSGWKN